jgi:hypothetical protein
MSFCWLLVLLASMCRKVFWSTFQSRHTVLAKHVAARGQLSDEVEGLGERNGTAWAHTTLAKHDSIKVLTKKGKLSEGTTAACRPNVLVVDREANVTLLNNVEEISGYTKRKHQRKLGLRNRSKQHTHQKQTTTTYSLPA